MNSRYNLGSDCETKARKAELEFNATAAWMAITILDDVYSVYFGTLDSLPAKTGIPMGESYLKEYECLVKEMSHGLDFTPYKNEYEK